jgi:predicted transcriptional regulator
MLLFSIAPAWVEMICSGQKTVELRRRPPALAAAVHALVYVTSPVCQLRLKCRMGPVTTMPKDALWNSLGAQSCASRQMFDAYFSGMLHASGIHISDVEELPAGLTLERLRRLTGFRPPQSWSKAPADLVELIRTHHC